MTTARNGKIARLPHDIREQLNRRLQDAVPGDTVLAWLNALPEVQTILAGQFNGIPLSKQNLSEWRLGGFTDWEFHSDFVGDTQAFAENAAQLKQAVPGRLSEHLATVLAARCAQLLSDWDGTVTAEFTHQLRAFGSLSRTIAELRRNDLHVAKQQLAEAKIEEQREKTEEEVIAHFKKWVENKDVREWIVKKHADEQERERALRKMYNLPPRPENESGVGTACPQNLEPSAPLSNLQSEISNPPDSSDPVIPSHTNKGELRSVTPSLSALASKATADQTVGEYVSEPKIESCPPPPVTRRSPSGKSRAKRTTTAPSPASSQPVIPSQTVESGLQPSAFSPQPYFDNTLHDPMPASDPNSGDIYANEPIRVPKSLRKGESNRDPDPKSYPSYHQYMKTCVNKPKKPVLPPLRQIFTKDDAPMW